MGDLLGKEIEKQKKEMNDPIEIATNAKISFNFYTDYLKWFKSNHVALTSKFESMMRGQDAVEEED